MATAAYTKRTCAYADCPQQQFKNNYCIDHWREHSGISTKTSEIKHNYLNQFGKNKVSVDELCDQINETFLNNTAFNTDEKQLQQYKRKFMDMDEDGSGDIDIGELGRALEKLGKPKNQLQLKKMIEEVDKTGSGTIKYDEFLEMMLGKQSSVLRLILMFEGMAKSEEQKQEKKGPAPKKTINDLLNKSS